MSDKPAINPVFFDPAGGRAHVVRLTMVVCAAVFILATLAYSTGLINSPELPAPKLAPSETPLPEKEISLRKRPTSNVAHFGANFRALPASAAKARRFAFHNLTHDYSTSHLHAQAGELDALVIDAFFLKDVAGRTKIITNEEIPFFNSWLAQSAPQAEIFAQVGLDTTHRQLGILLSIQSETSRIIGEIVNGVEQIGARGVVLDYRLVPDGSHAQFIKFMRQLGSSLRTAGASLIVSVPHYVPANRLRELSRPVDYIIVNLYKETGDRPQSEPLADQAWFEEQLQHQLSLVDRHKLVIGLGSMAVEWSQFGDPRTMSVQAAWDLADKHGRTISLDPVSLNPTFGYTNKDGQAREIWMLDGITVFNQSRTALASGIGGLAVSELGNSDPGIWRSLGRNRVPDQSVVADLKRPIAASDSYQRTDYDVLRGEPGRVGKRDLRFSEHTGLITAARLVELPVHAQISGLKAVDKKLVALTFDDGPDPLVTPKILDILAAKKAKATFYIVGANAARHPDILRRIYDEGHDIGNHSYTHKNMYSMSRRHTERELNGVQRLLEDQLGINTVLFRAPYGIPHYREYINAPQLMSTVTDLGYLVGGMRINSYDYTGDKDMIRDRVVRLVLNAKSGATVLMHDAGGERNGTVKALEAIIDQLQDAGYRFVTTHELVGLPRESVLPINTPSTVVAAASTKVRGQYLIALANTERVIAQLGIGAAILAMFRLLIIIILAAFQWRRERRRADITWQPQSIAVLVPGYNEEKVICKTVQSLLASTIAERLEVIVVDDGSTDRTSEVVREAYGHDDRVKVFKKPNGGKSAALNFGIEQTTAEIVVAIDADTMLEPQAIELLVRHFGDPKLGAVAGNAVVGNQRNMITRMQALEYVTSQNLERRALEIANAITVVPGAIGAWRRSAIIEAGGYGHDTLAEDADLSIKIERLGWKIIFEPEARALTEAPETIATFLKQRFRWMFGTLQVAYKNLRHPRGLPKGIALMTLPNVFIFSFAFTLLAPLVDLLLVINLGTITAILIGGNGSPSDYESIRLVFLFWVLFQCVDFLVATIGIGMDSDRRNFWLLPWIFVQRVTYRQLLYFVAIRALLAAFMGQFIGWGKLLRTGTVILPASGRRDNAVPTPSQR